MSEKNCQGFRDSSPSCGPFTQNQNSHQSKACDCGTCVDCDKIYDSVRDKDCLEDLKVFLTECGQDIIDRATNIRCKCAEVLWTHITVDTVPFNRGYYSVYVRFYFKLLFEACVPGGKSQEFCGLAVYDKKCVLFGSEGNVSIFTSEQLCNDFCSNLSDMPCDFKTNMPKVVVEVAPPICLSVKLVEKQYKFGCCCCTCDQIPENICRSCGGGMTDDFGTKCLYVSLGLFSVIRIERPVALVLSASEFCIPDKESTMCADSSDPCALFKKMTFPVDDFFPPNSQNCK
ncbi:MAG: hypothetical protein IKV97_05100 [Clostridia bacterium]|nr:hypothetical protein [Clostridia bacterium]